MLDIIRQNVALKLFSLAVAKQNVHLSWRLDGWDNVFLQRTACVDGRLQREPVIGVWAECDDVVRFPDRSK